MVIKNDEVLLLEQIFINLKLERT